MPTLERERFRRVAAIVAHRAPVIVATAVWPRLSPWFDLDTRGRSPLRWAVQITSIAATTFTLRQWALPWLGRAALREQLGREPTPAEWRAFWGRR